MEHILLAIEEFLDMSEDDEYVDTDVVLDLLRWIYQELEAK
jgi:hypothetical protein